MSIRLYFFLLFIIFLASSTSIGLLYFYMNPVPNPERALVLMGMGIFLACSSLLAPILFFLKKIYYRGDVNLSVMHSSVRQSLLLVLLIIFIIIMNLYSIKETHILLAAIFTVLCIEIMFQALE